jgi:DNA-binding CsgD family transcriptional regulator
MTHHLVGREGELGAIVELFDDPASLPRAVVLCGEAGIGKTALWLRGLGEAGERGIRVLRTRPSEAETGYSYAGLTDLLVDVAGDVLPGLPPVQRRALETALLLGDAETAVDERAVASAFLGVLRAIAGDGPLLVAVDDVQWLDPASLAALRFALPRLETEPVASLLAVRGKTPDWLRRGIPEPRLVVVELEGLSLGALHELLRERIDLRLPRPVVVRIHETSAGNPFYALELAGALERRGGRLDPAGELPLSQTLAELVARRLRALPPVARCVAGVAATAADPTVALVEKVVGAAADDGLDACLTAGVLELDGSRVRLVHPLLGSAIRSNATATELRDLHARLAELAATAEQRARHLALSAGKPDEAVAAVLDRESTSALTRGAAATAAELAELALRLTPPDHEVEARRRALVVADRLHDAGDDARAIALLEGTLRDAPSGVDRSRVLMRLAAVRWLTTGQHEAEALYGQALAEAGGDPALETEILLRMAELARFTSTRDAGLEHARAAVRTSAEIDDRRSRCRALANYGLLHFSVGLGAPEAEMKEALALERSLGIESLGDAAPTDVLIHQLFWSGDVERARRLLEPRLETALARAELEAATHFWLLALVEWRAGNWSLAARHAEEVTALQQQVGRDGVWPIYEWPAAVVAAHRGMVDDARARSRRALAASEETRQAMAEAAHHFVLGFLELSLGRAEEAVSHLRVMRRWADEGGLREPGHRVEIGDLLEALVATGGHDEAEEVLLTWEERSRRLDRAWSLAVLARCRGLLMAARGDLGGALASFEQALAEHARSADPFQHARTLLALGRTQRRAKQRAAARTTLTDALERFESLGAPLWAEQTRAELARIGGRAPSRGELTEAEQRIAELVAQGKSNREVAAALFLTVHSVETALTRIYRKLGVRSRTELARRYSSKT